MTKERAIELLKNFNLYDEPNCMGYWDCDECVEALYMGIEAIQQMPKRGKWIELGQNKDGTHNICCGVCGVGKFKSRGHARSYNTRQKFKYCPNCGSYNGE